MRIVLTRAVNSRIPMTPPTDFEPSIGSTEKMKNRAFTIVELLVVIATIALLVALLLPAVNTAREAARRASCKSNIRQIAIALNSYEAAYAKFPPFFVSREGNAMRIADGDKGPNWLVLLLPYVEENGLYEQWNQKIPAVQNPGASAEISIYKCPSDPNNSGNRCTYAGGNWARGNYGMNVSPCSHGLTTKKRGGRSPLGGIGAPNFSVRMRHVRDGTSKTVAVDELRAGLNPNDIRGCWAMPGLGAGTAAFFGDAERPNATGGNSDDMENCAASGSAGDGSRGMGCFDSEGTSQMAPRSLHRGGVHIAMVDASVRFVSNDVDSNYEKEGCGPNPGIWQAIHTRAGRENVKGEF